MTTVGTTASVTRFDPHTAAVDGLDGWYRVLVETVADDLPDDPAPVRTDVVLALAHPWPRRREEHWVARDGSGTVVGTALLELNDHDNTHLAGLDLRVRPSARGRGVGRALLRAALDRVEAEGRRTVVTEMPAGSAGTRFAAALGGTAALSEQRSLCRLADVPADVLALADADVCDGYRVRSWVGSVPEDLVESFAAALAAMNDAPVDDLDWDDEVFDADRVRANDAVCRARGIDTYTAVALDPATGAVVGLTDVAVSRHSPARAEQMATAVLAGHRGHGLGLWLKATVARELRTHRRDVHEVVTWNAASNAHMLAVNARLGYRPDLVWQEWQVARDVLRERLR